MATLQHQAHKHDAYSQGLWVTNGLATWSYQVKYIYDNSAGSPFVTPVDITDNVITIENMTDVGTGEINTAVIQLNARDGNFITETSSGNTPKINQFDRIYIK